MIQKNSNGIYQSSLLKSHGVFHGYSSRHLGDMRRKEHLVHVLEQMGISADATICCEQVHGDRIAIVGPSDRGKKISGCDGLVLKNEGIPTALRIRIADCVPILCVDPHAHIIGIAHAGWKGTLSRIARKLIQKMRECGADPAHIDVAIGPHIGTCCYTVGEERARLFQKRFGKDEKISAHSKGQWHVDIGYVNVQTLMRAGMRPDHIDASDQCTSCQSTEFYSYRKDTKETFGEQMAIIGFVT